MASISKARCKLCNLCRTLLHRICREIMFNSDLSLELDRLTVENEQLKEQLLLGEAQH